MASHYLLRKIDLTTLQLFLSVYDEGTLTRGADREAIAVSAASKRLSDLEELAGMPLFVRHARGMTLTGAGETLLHHARNVFRNIDNLSLELAEHAAGIRGYVRMVANLSAIVEFLPEDLKRFLTLHGLIKLQLDERPSAGVIEAVAGSVADLGICAGATYPQRLHVTHYRHDTLVVVTRRDHPLAAKQTVTFAETLDCDHVGLHADSSINARCHWAAQQAGRPLNLKIHVPSFDAVCRMVQAGMGIGILPRIAYNNMGYFLGLAAIELNEEWAQRSLVVVVRDPDTLSPVSRLLFDYLSTVESKDVSSPAA
jgi:DNA-binding transcriptional LysR family regulator